MFKKKTTAPATSANTFQSTKARLDARPKKEITIPFDQLNPKDTQVELSINGYTYVIKRGEEVMVPDIVKNMLKRAKILP